MPGRGSPARHALDTLARDATHSVGRPLADQELEAFDKYLNLLQQWQRTQRLVGSTDPGWVVDNLFLDSLLFLQLLPPGIDSLADLGSGAGLPGIPIKIVRPDIAVTLIESRGRRASFLAAVVRELRLEQVRVLNVRAEQLATERPRSFEAVVMRCVGDPGDVMPVAVRLVAPGGIVVAAGPPAIQPLPMGTWCEVAGVRGERPRRFAVYRP